MSQILAALGDNPYFGAGFGLMGLGLGASLARKGAQVGLILFRRHYMTTVEITCKDKVPNLFIAKRAPSPLPICKIICKAFYY
jgi:hypothetical protein